MVVGSYIVLLYLNLQLWIVPQEYEPSVVLDRRYISSIAFSRS